MHTTELLTKGSFYLNDEPLTDKLSEIAFPEDNIPDYIKSINRPLSASAEFKMEAEINVPLLHKLAGIDLAVPGAQSFTAEFSEPYQEQRRKHKKKRINKKYAKRYGYVTKYRKWRIEEVSFATDPYGRYDLTGSNLRVAKEA